MFCIKQKTANEVRIGAWSSGVCYSDLAFPAWTAREVDERAGMLERLGDSLEEHRDELMALCIQEAFKSIPDAIAEVREAVDFCRYYAARARADLQSVELPGPTGERNMMHLDGRGVWATHAPRTLARKSVV